MINNAKWELAACFSYSLLTPSFFLPLFGRELWIMECGLIWKKVAFCNCFSFKQENLPSFTRSALQLHRGLASFKQCSELRVEVHPREFKHKCHLERGASWDFHSVHTN